jgi:hypothetical protein
LREAKAGKPLITEIAEPRAYALRRRIPAGTGARAFPDPYAAK